MVDKTNILRVDSSGLLGRSSTRTLLDELVAGLLQRHPGAAVTVRDLAEGIPHVSEDWITANFTDAADRTSTQRDVLRHSDELIAEIEAADVLAIAVPIYNFGVPAALKAWVDMIARARLTFRYTDSGPVGLMHGKKAFLVVASGGVAVDSDLDFATPYMRQALRFIGISDITVVAADQQTRRDNALVLAQQQIVGLLAADGSTENSGTVGVQQ